MKTFLKPVSLLALSSLILACSLFTGFTPTIPEETSLPTPVIPSPTESPVPTSVQSGTVISFNNVSFTIPSGLASGASSEAVPAVTDQSGAPWEIAPAHIKFVLSGYALQDKFHQPQIYVIPAQGYISSNPGASESIDRLNAILRTVVPATPDNLPFIPFFNAGQIFAAQIETLQFHGGSGVRFLTEYAQYFASVNNVDLFYHFQGLMDDSEYYIVAILPVTAPMLADNEDPNAVVPPDGVPFPGYDDPNADYAAYYDAIAQKLNATAAAGFTPPLDALDALIQSITVNP